MARPRQTLRRRFGALTAIATCAVSLTAATPALAADDPLTVAECPADPLALPADTETALAATLLVRTGKGLGSAVLISPDGFALTAAHVLAGQSELEVRTYGGKTLRATVVRVDRKQDIALIKLDTAAATACASVAFGRAGIGTDAFVLGSPGGEELSFSVSKGIVSGRRDFDGLRFLQLDASVNPGNSGGPVLDDTGALVGVASWKVADVTVEGLAFAVPTDVALSALQLHFGSETDHDWSDRASEPDAVPTHAPVGSGSVSPEVRRRLAWRRGLIASGASMLGTGVITVAVTAGVRNAADGEIAEKKWSNLVRFNTIGWVLTGAGAAMFAGGLFIRRNPRTKAGTAVDVAVAPAGSGVTVVGRF